MALPPTLPGQMKKCLSHPTARDTHLDSCRAISARGAVSTRASLCKGEQTPSELPTIPVLPQEPRFIPPTVQPKLSHLASCRPPWPPLSRHDLPITSGHLGLAHPVTPLLQGSPVPTVGPTAHLTSRLASRTGQARRTHRARGTSVSRCSRGSLLARLTLGAATRRVSAHSEAPLSPSMEKADRGSVPRVQSRWPGHQEHPVKTLHLSQAGPAHLEEGASPLTEGPGRPGNPRSPRCPGRPTMPL